MRYFLIVMLLIPAWGWAESKEYPVKQGDPVTHCMMYIDTDLGLIMEGPGCPKHMVPSCCQHMREAMRAMEAFLRKGDVIPTHEYARMKEQWDQVVKDCVEGR